MGWYSGKKFDMDAVEDLMMGVMVPPGATESGVHWQTARVRLGADASNLDKSHTWTGKKDGERYHPGQETQDALFLWIDATIKSLLEDADDGQPRKYVVQVDRWVTPTIELQDKRSGPRAVKRTVVNDEWLERNNMHQVPNRTIQQIQGTPQEASDGPSLGEIAQMMQDNAAFKGVNVTVPVADIVKMVMQFSMVLAQPQLEAERARLSLMTETLNVSLGAFRKLAEHLDGISGDKKLDLEHEYRMAQLEQEAAANVEGSKWGSVAQQFAPVVGQVLQTEGMQKVIAGTIEGMPDELKARLLEKFMG